MHQVKFKPDTRCQVGSWLSQLGAAALLLCKALESQSLWISVIRVRTLHNRQLPTINFMESFLYISNSPPTGSGTPQSNSGKWSTDFVSPDFYADNKWTDLKGITLAIRDRASWSGLAPIEVRFSLKIKKSDGTIYLLDEKTNGQTKPKIHQLKLELMWEWNYLTANLDVPKRPYCSAADCKSVRYCLSPGLLLWFYCARRCQPIPPTRTGLGTNIEK